MRLLKVITALSALLLPLQSGAQILDATWERDKAHAAARSVPTDPVIDELFSLAQQPQAESVMAAVNRLLANDSWPWPAREHALYVLTQRLRGLASHQVNQELVSFLKQFTARTRVRDLDHSRNIVALYPIATAAHGLTHQWMREDALAAGARWLVGDPAAYLSAWSSAQSSQVRFGLEDALDQADATVAESLLDQAKLFTRPELAPLRFRAALRTGQVDIASTALLESHSQHQTAMLRSAGKQLAPEQTANLLVQLIEQSPNTTAAIAIATLLPTLKDPSTESMLLGYLDHPALGTTTTLTLARWGSKTTQTELRRLSRQEGNERIMRVLQQVDQEQRYSHRGDDS